VRVFFSTDEPNLQDQVFTQAWYTHEKEIFSEMADDQKSKFPSREVSKVYFSA
jgi:hypothetical protein